jgi:prevent-host-death family protein
MAIISIHDAKTNLSKLIARACQGEEIIIARGKEPVVRLQPVVQKPRRKFGSMRGRVAVDASFFEPLPEEELDAWDQ